VSGIDLPDVTAVDLAVVALVVLMAILGARRGLAASLLSLGAIALGAVIGSRVAPHLLSGGARSPYTPIAGLVGALVFAILLQFAAGAAGLAIRNTLRVSPLRVVDSFGGMLFGGLTAVAFVWVVSVTVMLLPQRTRLGDEVRHSAVLSELVSALPPRKILHSLASIDPFPTFVGPGAPSQAPDRRVLRSSGIRVAARSVVKVESIACGIGYTGTGWVVRPGLVVTAAHVVAGAANVFVTRSDGESTPAQTVLFDGHNDIALLRIHTFGMTPLRLGDPKENASAIVLGYPGGGPFTRTPARVGKTTAFVARDYHEQIAWRTITSVRARIRAGDSGGPLIAPDGRVEATVFARKEGSDVGYATPTQVLRHDLAKRLHPSSTGGCIG
jgi:S1-C subfamily serine protease